MSRFPLFLIATFLAYFGMIGLSVQPLLPSPPRFVEARQSAGALIFDTNSLNQIAPANGFPVTASPGARGDQSGPRLASESALAPDARFSKGARLLFGPRTQASLSGGTLSVVLTLRGIPRSPATKMAVGLVRGGPIEWVQASVPTDFGQVRIDLSSDPSVSALALWPSVDGGGKGIELRTIVLQPQTAMPSQTVTP